jgi:hypothetical protein
VKADKSSLGSDLSGATRLECRAGVRDKRFVSVAELTKLRGLVKQFDPRRLLTASHGSDVRRQDLKDDLQAVAVEFVCPHRPRTPASPGQTQAKSGDTSSG